MLIPTYFKFALIGICTFFDQSESKLLFVYDHPDVDVLVVPVGGHAVHE